MNEKMNLKHCPICGGKAILEKMGWPHHVFCESCVAQTVSRKITEEGKEEAAKNWNHRTANWVPAAAPPGADPEDDGDHSSLILIYGADGMVFLGYYDTYHGLYWDSDTCRKIENAEYWMPIEKPDREEEQ